MPLEAIKGPLVASANVSNVKCDGEVIKGMQSIDYKIVKRRSNIHSIGLHERVGIDYGEMFVTGIIRVRSSYLPFDDNMQKEKHCQLVVELKNSKESMGTIAFDEVFIESKNFTMEVNGIALSEYAFTSTRIRQKLGGKEIDWGKEPGM